MTPRLSIVLAIIVTCLLGASTAGAVTLTTPEGEPLYPFQAWADRAKVPTPDMTIIVSGDVAQCGVSPDPTLITIACTSRTEPIIYALWPNCGFRQNRDDIRSCRFWILHEIGHQFDRVMPTWKRAAFAKILGDESEWLAPGVFATLEEDFADGYARCAINRIAPWLSQGRFMRDLSGRQFRRICRLIRA